VSEKKDRRRQTIAWLSTFFVLALIVGTGYWILTKYLRPDTYVKQAAAITTVVNYQNLTRHYDEGDYTIDLPVSWKFISHSQGTYNAFTWQSSDRVTDGQQIVVYENTIPINYAVNRVLIVAGDNDRLSLDGAASDNCLDFTKASSAGQYQLGAPARWQGISFLCDQDNTQRDVVGTSSADGINTVYLKSQSDHQTHAFFFTFTDYSINPDYSVFYNALDSLRMH